MERCNFTAYFLHLMKGLKSLHIFLAAAAVAFLLPACGGGDDSGDYYISPEQFKAGAKGFQVLTTPTAKFYVEGTANLYDLSDTQAKALFNRVDGDEKGLGEGKGYIVDGVVAAGTDKAPALIAYYANGGSEGTGYMYVNFPDDITDTFGRSLAHVLGCLSPSDVQFAGLDDNISIKMADGTNVAAYLVPPISRVLLISMKGVAIVVKFLFQDRMCEISLRYASYTGDLDIAAAEGEGSEEKISEVSDEGAYQTTYQDAVKVQVPYVVVPSGS